MAMNKPPLSSNPPTRPALVNEAGQLALYPEESIQEIKTQRLKPVYKSNELIQKTRYDLSLMEQKILTFVLSKISPYDVELKPVYFSVKEFCVVCGIDFKNGKNYINVKMALKELADKSFYITILNEDGKEIEALVRWFSRVILQKQNGVVMVQLDEILSQYLLNLTTYTKWTQLNILPMKSKYSPRIYELIRSFANLNIIVKSVEELRRMLSIEDEKFIKWNDFNRNVLKKSIEEINQFTDIDVQYYPKKTGRNITHVTFSIQRKDVVKYIAANAAAEKTLDNG